MPIYVFQHPEHPIVIEVSQSMNEPHVYVDDEGTEWNRVWTVPETAMGLDVDADSSKQFARKTEGWSTGDMWDYSKELSEKRKSKRGEDHIGHKHHTDRQSKIDSYKKKNKDK